MAIIGERIVRREDPSLLMGTGTFIDNLALDGLAVVTYARSQVAHARVTSIDTSEAASAPGVIGVFTAADLDLGSVPVDLPMLTAPMPRPFLADGVVRYVGEPIVAIVAESKAQAEDAAERVIVDYDPLPVVIEPESALEGEVLLFPDAGTNVCFQLPSAGADLFAECEVVVRRRITNQKVAPCPIEARVAASRWEPDGRLTHWQAGQGAHPIRDRLAAVYGLPVDQIRSISPDVGGGFGAKAFSYPEDLLLPWLARRVGRPVRYSDNRTDSMLGLGHGRGQVQHIEIGGTRDGKVLAYRLTVLQDTGAYPRMRRDPALHDDTDAHRDVRHPGGRMCGHQRRDEHRADGRLPRRRSAGGGGGDRAGDGSVRPRDSDSTRSTFGGATSSALTGSRT